MIQYPQSYYAATVDLSEKHPKLEKNIEVETCVVGAGYAGLMTALGLLERGAEKVALIEKHQVGWGASGRNGGFVFGGFSLSPRAIVKQVGKQQAQQLYGLTIKAVELIRTRISQYQIECELVDEGVIWANWFKDQQLLYREKQFMADNMNVDWEYWSPEQCRQQIKSDRYHGALFEKNAMHFHPLKYARGIANVIVKKAGYVFENSEVIDVDYRNGVKKVVTKNGTIRCKNVVLAGGGYMGKLCKPVSQSILPIATYVMTTASLGEKLQQLLPTKAAVYDTRFAFDYYRGLSDSRLLWGGRIHANTRAPGDLEKLLRQDMLKVFPELDQIAIDYVWDGWMGYPRHQMPQIGLLAENVWYNTGYGGHGVGPTTLGGELVAASIMQNDQQYQKFSRWGLPWNGGIFGPVAAQSHYWWFQFKDWLKEAME